MRRRLVDLQHGPSRRFLSIGGRKWERAQVYIEPADWWIGLYISEAAFYVCLLPCVVIKIWRADSGDSADIWHD